MWSSEILDELHKDFSTFLVLPPSLNPQKITTFIAQEKKAREQYKYEAPRPSKGRFDAFRCRLQ